MRVVIDSGVLVSAVLKGCDPEAVILFLARRDDMEWVVSSEIIKEYRDLLSRSTFGLPAGIQQSWFELLDGLTIYFDTGHETYLSRDQKDFSFLTCAICCNADYLITTDRDYGGARKLLSTTILSVSQFKRLVCKKLSLDEETLS